MERRGKQLSVVDAVAIIVGIVIGAGIFKTPSIVAATAGSKTVFLLLWPLGGALSLVGALCYAELASAYPSEGGDYQYFRLSFGKWVAFLFAWARLTVIQTGSIVILAFVFGDYASQLFPLGPNASAIYAAAAIIILSILNSVSLKHSTRTQNLLSGAKILGLLCIIIIGIWLPTAPVSVAQDSSPNRSLGLAMVFILLTYGGWNEIAFASAEFRNLKRDMLRALLWGIFIITLVFVLVNLAYVNVLGLKGVADSEVVAADLMRRALGEYGAKFISILIVISTLGAASGTIFTGARTNYALGRGFGPLRFMGKWHERTKTPLAALVTQGVIALCLVAFGQWQRKGFETLVEYTAPVFWFFFLLTGISLFVLRRKDPHTPRPFRVPLYPFTPILFCLASAYMLWSSVAYTGLGGLAGIGVLLVGVVVLLAGGGRTGEVTNGRAN
ncbi:MAG: amino acid permease [Blastocatellia bacterium]|nr:amino acid permease [Blastocatellia bacterium]